VDLGLLGGLTTSSSVRPPCRGGCSPGSTC
jgi:hypothetical protein